MKFAALVLIAAAVALQPQEISYTTPPKVIRKVQPEYTREARKAKLEGTVILSALVGVDGVPSDIKLVRLLGKGLDEKAAECLRQWRFSPGLSHGEPVPVKVTVEMNFRLHEKSR